jgi:hypothetical protein
MPSLRVTVTPALRDVAASRRASPAIIVRRGFQFKNDRLPSGL